MNSLAGPAPLFREARGWREGREGEGGEWEGGSGSGEGGDRLVSVHTIP